MDRGNDSSAAPPGPTGAGAPAGRPRDFQWVPIRSLAARHRERIAEHLLALEPDDRYLRFGFAASDSQIRHYVDVLDFERDEVLGIFNRRLQLVAIAHLAYLPSGDACGHVAEFGVSVRKACRGRGFGARLFELACLHARNRGIDTMMIQALSENNAMLHIVREAGAVVVREGPESEARLKLPPEDFASRLEEFALEQAAEIDYGIKAQARFVDDVVEDVFGALSEVQQGVAKTKGRIASE